ncbi:MAG: hypothetical protein MZV49_05865 [Rhodopseudomonas palustris]|nr:hypothetical protein [Rhodopseudomonas palustris]
MLSARRAAADRRRRRHHQRRRRATCWSSSPRLTGVPVIPTLMGWGAIPDDHPLMAGMVRAADHATATATRRCWPATSCSASATAGPTATPARVEVYTKGRKFVHVDIEPTQIGRVFMPDFGIVSRRQGGAANCSSRWRASARPPGTLQRPRRLGRALRRAQAHDAAQDPLRRRCRSSRSASTRR